MTRPRRSAAAIVLSVLLGAVLALLGGALASWRAWEVVSPLPTAADLTALGRIVAPDDPSAFAKADPVRDDVADTGTVVTVVTYGADAPDPGRSLAPVRERLEAAGWRTTGEGRYIAERYFVAVKDDLRVFVIDQYWSSGGERGGGFYVKVLRASTWPVVLAGLVGAAAGALLAWVLVGWGGRRTRGHPVQRGMAVFLTLAAVVLLVPTLAWTLYRLLPDGVTLSHNYVAEPFWRGLTGEPRAVPALVPAVLALLVLLVPLPRRVAAA